MERRPLSEEIRLFAAFGYLFPMPVFLLLNPRLREIRLVRLHSLQGIILFLLLAFSLLLTSALSTLLSPWFGLGMLLLGGLAMIALILGAALMAGFSVVAAYQGRSNFLPLVTGLARWLDRKIKRRLEKI
ncbi:MAG TPA: hypothetical protein V6C82_01210 [Chroococcales cyanobacterium]|jgi:uncharacterized membrane protein